MSSLLRSNRRRGRRASQTASGFPDYANAYLLHKGIGTTTAPADGFVFIIGHALRPYMEIYINGKDLGHMYAQSSATLDVCLTIPYPVKKGDVLQFRGGVRNNSEDVDVYFAKIRR